MVTNPKHLLKEQTQAGKNAPAQENFCPRKREEDRDMTGTLKQNLIAKLTYIVNSYISSCKRTSSIRGCTQQSSPRI